MIAVATAKAPKIAKVPKLNKNPNTSLFLNVCTVPTAAKIAVRPKMITNSQPDSIYMTLPSTLTASAVVFITIVMNLSVFVEREKCHSIEHSIEMAP